MKIKGIIIVGFIVSFTSLVFAEEDLMTVREALTRGRWMKHQIANEMAESPQKENIVHESPSEYMSIREALAQGRRMQHRIYQAQEPEFSYSFTYPIPPSYPIRYYSPRYLYVPRYSVPIGRQAMPRGYQLPSLFVQDTAAYNRAKLTEIETREALEQYEQLSQEQVEDMTIRPQEISQETATVQEGKQLATIIVPLSEQKTTQMKVKAGDIEAEVSLPQSASPEHLETITEITKTVVTQHITEQDKEAHRDRLFSLSLIIIGGTALLGILGFFAWGMFAANFKLLMGEIFGGEAKDETRHS